MCCRTSMIKRRQNRISGFKIMVIDIDRVRYSSLFGITHYSKISKWASHSNCEKTSRTSIA